MYLFSNKKNKGSSLVNTISLPQSIEFLSSAWNSVTSNTISDSFRKCGFFNAKNFDDSNSDEIFSSFKPRDIPEFREIVNKYVKMLGKFNVKTNFTHYVEFDKNLATAKLTEEQCIKIENDMSIESSDEASCIQLNDDDDAESETESFVDNSNENSTDEQEEVSIEEVSHIDTSNSMSNCKRVEETCRQDSEDSYEMNELKMTRINMIRHIGDLKLFAAQRESKEYGQRLLATICQLEKQIFDEPKEKSISSDKKNSKK